MTYDEALSAAKWQGARMTYPGASPLWYLWHDPHYDTPRREWHSGSSCTFIPHGNEATRTDWRSLDEGWQ